MTRNSKTFALVGLTWLLLGTGLWAEGWTWSLTPYIWGPSVSLDVSVDGDPVLGVDAAFKDLLDKTDMALMAHFEGRKGRAGFFVDGLYMSLSDSRNRTGPVPGAGELVADSELDMFVIEAGGIWNFSGESEGFDLLYGARMLDIAQAFDIRVVGGPGPAQPEASFGIDKNFVDAFVGARYRARFAQRWSFSLRGDYGFGGTEGTLNSLVALGYTFGETESFHLHLGYRYFDVSVEDSSRELSLETDITYSGILLGFQFDF